MFNGTAIHLPAIRRRAAAWLALPLIGGAIAAGAILAIDGGSERSSSPASEAGASGVLRYDGGPEEGSRGPAGSAASGVLRYDGGPEEGSRGPTRFGGARTR